MNQLLMQSLINNRFREIYSQGLARLDRRTGWLLHLYYFDCHKSHLPGLPATRGRFLKSALEDNDEVGHNNFEKKCLQVSLSSSLAPRMQFCTSIQIPIISCSFLATGKKDWFKGCWPRMALFFQTLSSMTIAVNSTLRQKDMKSTALTITSTWLQKMCNSRTTSFSTTAETQYSWNRRWVQGWRQY